MSIRIKCGKTYGLMNDDISIHELMEYIASNCVKPGTEYFHLTFAGECVAEYKKGIIFTDAKRQRVRDIPNYFRQDFYVCFKSRYPKKQEKAKADKKAQEKKSEENSEGGTYTTETNE